MTREPIYILYSLINRLIYKVGKEEKKERLFMKKSIKILIIVMAMVIVGLITFIVVDKVTNNNKENNESSVANATTSNSGSGVNDTTEKNNTEEKDTTNSSDKNETESSNKVGEKIAEALKERRFMAKNNIDTESIAKFMKVGDNIYLIEVVDSTSEVSLTTVFTVTYEDGSVVFDKLEADKHSFDLAVDTKNHIIKATRTMKGLDRAIFYDVSKGKLTVKDEFAKPYSEEYVEMYKYSVNSNDVSKDEYDKKIKEYDQYNFEGFESNSKILNDENIDKLVK